jgi:predicted PhzF superfamily epimerase YddE/YHI9
MVEDPVTGSLNASIAQWLIGEGRVEAPYLVGQGARVGRDGEVSISTDDAGTVWVGGRVFDMASGELE